jgi:hypothetical protein
MKFIAVQTSARRGYAVPRLLEKAGILERFYTDLAGNVGIGKLLPLLNWIPGIDSRVHRLYARRIPMEIVAKTWTFDGVSISVEWGSFESKKNCIEICLTKFKQAGLFKGRTIFLPLNLLMYIL